MSALGEQLISIVRAKADAQPDFVYERPTPRSGGFPLNLLPSCVYVHEGRPSCLLGRAMWDAGLIDASMENLNTNYSAFVQGAHDIAPRLEELTADEWFWLECVQSNQDSGTAWGVAVRWADESMTAQAV